MANFCRQPEGSVHSKYRVNRSINPWIATKVWSEQVRRNEPAKMWYCEDCVKTKGQGGNSALTKAEFCDLYALYILSNTSSACISYYSINYAGSANWRQGQRVAHTTREFLPNDHWKFCSGLLAQISLGNVLMFSSIRGLKTWVSIFKKTQTIER